MTYASRNKKRIKSPDVDEAAVALILDQHAVLAITNGAGSAMKVATHGVVFTQGDPADAVFYIEAGRIQLTVVSDQGKEAFIALFGPGDFFGEGCLAGQSVRPASAVATAASSLVRIEKRAMERLFRHQAGDQVRDEPEGPHRT